MRQANPIKELPADMRARLRREAGPKWIPPMLATLWSSPFREGLLFEEKFDGERCLAIRSGGSVQFFSRNEQQLNQKYPELVTAFGKQKIQRFAVDGEIVAFEGDVTSFAKLQPREVLGTSSTVDR